MNSIKRLFLGFQVHAPWQKTPPGKQVPEEMRHLTVAFLGNIPFEKLESHLKALPLPSFKVGFSGYFDRVLFLPPKHPHVAAWHGVLPEVEPCEKYAIGLQAWLESIDIPTNLHLPWLPHVTLARSPF